MLDRLLYGIDSTLWRIANYFGAGAAGYCDLETVDDGRTLVTSSGALLSVIALDGTGRMVGDAEFDRLVSQLAAQMQAYFRTPAHRLQLVFTRDTSRFAIQRELAEALAGTVGTIRRLQLDVEDLIDEKAETLCRYCAVERAYMVAWTMPSALSAIERRHSGQERLEVRRAMPRAVDAQRAGFALPGLREAHRSLMETLRRDLLTLGYKARLLPSAEALRAIRMEVDSEWTDDRWEAAFPGDGARLSQRARAAELGAHAQDVSAVLWPTLPQQMIPRGIDVLSTRAIRIGDRLIAPMTLSLPPARLEPFDALFNRLREAGVSYRVSFRLTGAGVDDTEFRVRHLLSYLSTSRTAKRALNEALDEARDGGVRVGFQMDVATWVDSGDLDELSRAAARVARAIQGWGGCEVDQRLGNPIGPVLSTVPALKSCGAGVLSVPPIEDAVALMPIARPASPWRSGSFLFRTPDGKLYPYQPYSSEQAAWVTLVYAPMRGGKSVLMNALNAALCMAPGIDRLPMISILDIGPSSAGLISLLREALPPALRHQVMYHRLRMLAEDSINPCDTLLGMREPVPVHRSFLINLLTLLATPVGDLAPPGDVPHLAQMCVDESYREFADRGTRSRPYAPNIDREVDELLLAYNIGHDSRTVWWELVDALFARGEVRGAMLAQRYAVPLLGDVAAKARDPRIASQFRGKAPNGEPIVDYFVKAVTHAVREYPILARPTRFDLGMARVVSLDLAEVAPQGGVNADRQTAVMYMLARQVLAGPYFLSTDLLQAASMPQGYKDWHYREIQRIATDPKRICFDEFHRTQSAPIVRRQVLMDIREGAKANLEIILASQMLNDFDEAMIELATTIFVLGVGQTSLVDTVRTFQLGDHAAGILERLGKPTSAGAKLLASFTTRSGKFNAELMHTLSATELWAYSTTAEDRAIRDRLYGLIGPAEARRLLSLQFPSGTAKDEVERRRALMTERGIISGSHEEAEATLIDTMINESLGVYEELRQEVQAA